jgi:ADP-ribose pyrophosphatase YjhB (NUDIX family)
MSPIRIGAKAVIIQDDQVLLIKYQDRRDGHYNFPGGGIKRGESIRKGLRREVAEETSLDVKVGRLLLVGEYDPKKHKRKFGRLHKLTLFFLCTTRNGSEPTLPEKPDTNQIGIEWFPIEALPENLLPLYHDLILTAVREEAPRELFTTRK